MALGSDVWSSLFGSSVDTLTKVMEDVNGIEFPSLESEEFQNFWRLDFGFAVMVAVVATIFALVKYAKSKQLATLLNAFLTFILTFLVGYLLPPALYGLMWLSKKLSLVAIAFVSGSQQNDTVTWYDVFTRFVALGNPLTLFGNRMFGDLLTGTLEFLVSSVIAALFLFAFLTLASFPVRRIGFGFTMFRIGLAGLITSVFLQPLVLFSLALGAVAIGLTGTDTGDRNGQVSFVLLIACVMPLLLFFMSYRRLQKVQIEGPVFSDSGGSFGPLRGVSFGGASSRAYAGTIPQAGDTMEGVASKANWVSNKLSTASKALVAVAPEAAPLVKGAAVATAVVGTGAAAKAEQTRSKTAATPSFDDENHTISGATVSTVGATQQKQTSSAPSVTGATSSDATPETPKRSRMDVVRSGASTVASGASSAASGVEKAARWSSGAQRKAKEVIDKQLVR